MLRKIQPGAERLGGIAGQRGKTEEDVDEYQKLADEELIQKLREGDERIMDYILEKYKPLVLRKANAMFLIGGDTDDLIQEGMIGLFKAIRDYRSEFYRFLGAAAGTVKRARAPGFRRISGRKKLPPDSGGTREKSQDNRQCALAYQGKDPAEIERRQKGHFAKKSGK